MPSYNTIRCRHSTIGNHRIQLGEHRRIGTVNLVEQHHTALAEHLNNVGLMIYPIDIGEPKHIRTHRIGAEGNLGKLSTLDDIIEVTLDVEHLLASLHGKRGLARTGWPREHHDSQALETADNLVCQLMLVILHLLLALTLLLLATLALLLTDRLGLADEFCCFLFHVLNGLRLGGLLLGIVNLPLHFLLHLLHLLFLLLGNLLPRRSVAGALMRFGI